MSERDLQADVFEFLNLCLPAEAVAFAVPNGDGRETRMPGTLPGAPDICIVWKGRAIFIELKTRRGAVRLNQRFIHERLTLAGAAVKVCRSLDEVAGFLVQLMPLRGRVSA